MFPVLCCCCWSAGDGSLTAQTPSTVRRLREASERKGEYIEQQTIILDLKGLSLRPNSAGLAVFKECMRIDQVGMASPLRRLVFLLFTHRNPFAQDYYPERLAQLFIVNAPWFAAESPNGHARTTTTVVNQPPTQNPFPPPSSKGVPAHLGTDPPVAGPGDAEQVPCAGLGLCQHAARVH